MSSSRRAVLVASILGSGIVFLDSTVVNVALPAIRAGLHGSLADQLWVVEAYLLTLASLLLVGGSLGDLLGRRRVFSVGVAGFGACSLLCALAPSSSLLIAARALQGTAGALLVPSSLALIMDHYSGESERAAAIGTWTAWTGTATVIGPLGGGWLVQAASWRWVFAINLLPVAVTLWLLHRIDESPRVGCRIDVGGGALAVLGLAGPVFALIEQPRYGWSDPRVAATLGGGLVLLGALLVHEARAREPMMPLSLFRVRNFSVGNVTTFALYGGLSIATFYLVVFIQQVGGYTPLKAGLALLPITLIMFALSRRWAALSARIGPRLLMGVGPIVAGAGLLLETRIGARAGYLTTVLPGVAVFGLGMSMTVAPLTATVLGAVGRGHSGIASGVNNAISRIAGLIAIAAVGAVIAGVFSSHLPPGVADHATPFVTAGPPARHAALVTASVHAFHVGMVIAALLAALGGLVSLAGITRAGREPRSRSGVTGTSARPAAVAARWPYRRARARSRD